MLPVVYVVRAGDDNEELRYSVRSAAKNLPNDGITIAGYLPTWLDLPHLNVPQSGTKRHNISRALAAACRAFDEWILCWDDVFVMEPVESMPVVHGGPVDEAVSRLTGDRSYISGIRRTGNWLKSQGYRDPLSFDAIHHPQRIVSVHLAEAMRMASRHGLGAVLTIHGNYARADRGDGVQVSNAKTTSAELAGRPFLSTNDRRFREEPIGEYIRAAFPDRSPHERD